MKHIAAYLMLLVGGNAAPTADDIKKVLSAAGVEADADSLTRLMAAVDGKVRNKYVTEHVYLSPF
jgi:large subunit ribosomal protein LP2